MVEKKGEESEKIWRKEEGKIVKQLMDYFFLVSKEEIIKEEN